MTNNYQNFAIQNIPEHINQLQNFKKWRRVGSNLKGAIMIGQIEHCIHNNEIGTLKNMIQFTSCQGNDKALKFKTILYNALNKLQGDQVINFIIEYLIQKDQYNNTSQQFLDEFFKQKYNYSLSDDDLIQEFQKVFKIKLIIAKYPPTKQSNYQTIDSKDRNSIIIFNLENKFYVIQKEQNYLVDKCRCCQNKSLKELLKFECSHLICLTCLKKQFSQNQLKIICNQQHCPSQITYQQFQQIMKNYGETPIIPTPQECCILCKTKSSLEFLIRPQECSHMFCMQCLQDKFKTNQQNDFRCLIVGCYGKFNQKDLPSSISSKITQSQIVQKQTEIIMKTDNQQKQISQSMISSNGKPIDKNLNNQCNQCLKQFTEDLIYKTRCNHFICKFCFLKIESLNAEQFKCNVLKCNEIIKSKELSQYFKLSQSQNSQKKCGNCNQICEKTESFCKTNCHHVICVKCVSAIYKSQRTPKCLRCNIVINEDLLDEYFLQIQVQFTKEVVLGGLYILSFPFYRVQYLLKFKLPKPRNRFMLHNLPIRLPLMLDELIDC
ncbi:unnamed protein product (macronuclear) [Paramecium tetraurelia]|uniref:RING-type domain-containing protein n=1 Tax=Paramecium tetraurelia TaxID=5888 RepID=A0DLK9_PARTE|nr:uncharacterized protein GSPATT00018244001 [Paramecium tetraurelia]CAK83926.1 unnamed protein product [Paramecium tetraurelia]|eukprot:XP_001451323.1 hypothetical protein (macronuclear) [Paramecium tetraurelia strain d4-2]